MTWTDPDSPWRRAQLRRVRRARLLVALSAVLDLLVVGSIAVTGIKVARIVGTLGPDAGSGWEILRAPAVILGVALFAGMLSTSLALLVWMARREQRILDAVPAADGLICPRCRRDLDRDSDALRCPKGHKVGATAEVREHWLGYPFDPQAGAGRRFGRSKPGWRERLQRRPWLVLALMAVTWVAMIVATMRLTGSSLLPATVTTAWGILIPLSFFLWSQGRGRRVGEETFCARCGYERAADSASGCCPECGQRWAEPGGSVRGRLVRSPALMWLGAATGALVAALMIGRFPSVGGGLPQYAPTPLLVHWVGGSSGTHRASWAELTQRSLTPEQEEGLARGLVELARTDGYVFPAARSWMDARIRAGTLPQVVIDEWQATQP